MGTKTISTTELNSYANNADLILLKVYNDIPISYRVKEIVITNTIGTANYANAPAVTIASPLLANGITATAAASLNQQADGLDLGKLIRIVITNPGSGYNVVPTVTIANSDTGNGTTQAVAVLEIDPIVLEKRNQIIKIINTQIIEEEIKNEFNINVSNNFASIIQNIDNSTNLLVNKSKFGLSSPSNNFILGEVVTTSTGSGKVIHYDGISGNVSIGYISGNFLSGQILTGQTSLATGTLVVTTSTNATNDQVARGMMVLNLKATNTLEDLRNEIRNPTII